MAQGPDPASEAVWQAAVVGRWVRLGPAATAGALGRSQRAMRWVEAAVVSASERGLRLESRDERLAALDGAAVVGEIPSNEALVRFWGRCRVLVAAPLPVVCTVVPDRPLDMLQRRSWVRVQLSVPVQLTVDAHRKAGSFRTRSRDLSGGGIRLAEAGPLRGGERVRLSIWLPSGPVEVDGDVLEVLPDGSTRVRFCRLTEAVSKRIVRCVFETQVGTRRRTPGSPP